MATYYTRDHEWLAVDGDVATIGITDYAQAQIGDVMFVEVPPVGARLVKGDPAGVIESVKAASDIFSPATGTVSEVNHLLRDQPALLNASPEAEGWMFRLVLADPTELTGLFEADAYRARVRRL